MFLLGESQGRGSLVGCRPWGHTESDTHVLRAMGIPYTSAHGTLRFSFSRYNTMDEVDFILEKLPPVVARLRSMSPYWKAEFGR